MHMVASNNRTMQRILQISLAATFCYVVATLFFGLRAHSLALISEAGHNVSDMLAIILSFVAVYFQARPATDEQDLRLPARRRPRRLRQRRSPSSSSPPGSPSPPSIASTPRSPSSRA